MVKKVPTLLELCMDVLILSRNPQIIKQVLTLPDCIVRKMDQRYIKMENTKEYKKRFKNQIYI